MWLFTSDIWKTEIEGTILGLAKGQRNLLKQVKALIHLTRAPLVCQLYDGLGPSSVIKEALTDQFLTRSVSEAAIERTEEQEHSFCFACGQRHTSLSSCIPEEKSQLGMEKPYIPGIFLESGRTSGVN